MRRAALLLAAVLLAAFLAQAMDKSSSPRHVGAEIADAAEKRIFFDAVCAVSPLVGCLLKESNGSTASEAYVSEDMVREELEQLLLREQEAEKTGEETQTVMDLFPEDSDEDIREMAQITELDADLLAQIDEENEALRRQAEAQTQADAAADEAEDTVSQSLSLAYSMEQLGSLDFLLENCYYLDKTTRADESLLDAQTMLSRDMSLENPDSGGPKVLIHHTHATEYFADSDPENPATLIVGVGDYLAQILQERYGIGVIHDTTVYPYNEAYSQALKNVEQILAENPTVEVFIDLHRNAGGSRKYTVETDGKETANLMFFNGLSRNANGPIDYLKNDNLADNLAFSFQLKMAGDSMYPGLCKRNYLKAYRYNLHVLPRAVIVEVGDNNNTLEEAKNAMEPLAAILNAVLNGTR